MVVNWAEKSLARREKVMNGMHGWLRTHWEEAEFEAMQPLYEAPATSRLEIGGYETVEVESGLRCTHWETGPGIKGHSRKRTYVQCHRGAGQGTDHAGVGLCYMHDGARGRGKVQGAILMALAFGDELNCSPWEAMQQQIRLLANQVAWLQKRVNAGEAEGGDAAIKPGGIAWDWVVLLEARGDRLAKVAKMAIDAGLATRLVQQMELEAEGMYEAATAMLDSLGLEGDQRELALAVMTRKLLEIEAGSSDDAR